MGGIAHRRVLNTNGLFEVYVEGGGPVPKNLTSMFTSEKLVKHAIEAYVAERETKVKQQTPKRRPNSNS